MPLSAAEHAAVKRAVTETRNTSARERRLRALVERLTRENAELRREVARLRQFEADAKLTLHAYGVGQGPSTN